jgi:TonB-linked SusC/RagA family outer membrane protein
MSTPDNSIVDARGYEPLRRTVTLHVQKEPLSEVLDQLAKQTGVQFVYTDEVVPARRRVSLHADGISLAGALFELLLGSGVDVRVSQNGLLSLVLQSASAPAKPLGPADSGVVRGTVLDSATRQPIPSVVIRVQATGQTAVTSNDGTYALHGLRFGNHVLVARRLGYLPRRESILVSSQTPLTVDFVLSAAAAMLDQVVTTETGDQRLVEMGSSIGLIDGKKIVASQAVSQLSDVLNARVAGVQVFNAGGLTGATPVINIRGQNSVTFSGQPLLYVDGVRVENGVGGDQQSGEFNDLIPSEIETIQVVRGPAASALYGTDAANGVILVTTKTGSRGAPRWSITAENGLLTLDRSRFKPSLYPWGHDLSGNVVAPCTLLQVAAAQCKQDSVTRFTPLRDPALTPIGTGLRQNYGLQVAGGADRLRYFASGNDEQETGYLKLPDAERSIVSALPGGLTIGVARPNAFARYGSRETVLYALNSRADISLALGYIHRDGRIPAANSLTFGSEGPGYRDTTGGWLLDLRPYKIFTERVDDAVGHFTGGANGTWRPFDWLTARGTLGIDHSNDQYNRLVYNGEGESFESAGVVSTNATQTDLYTANTNITSSVRLVGGATSRTSVGGELDKRSEQSVGSTGQPLPVGCRTVNCAVGTSSGVLTNERVVVGGYVEQQLALNDRLFVTGAVRVDGSNTFGNSLNAAVYPKTSASWIISREPFWPRVPGVSGVRVRTAYGEAGIQPDPIAAVTSYSYNSIVLGGTPVNGASLSQIGNPKLKPERQTEFEAGADVDLIGDRVHLEFTYYAKRSRDALEQLQVGQSIGGYIETQNVGSVRNRGYEVAGTLSLLDARLMSWTISANGSVNHNQLLRLGPGLAPIYGQFGLASIVPGYSLFSQFDRRYHFRDVNHDGIIETNEVVVDSSPSYLGSKYPGVQASVGSTLTFLRNAVRVSILFDHRGAFSIYNGPQAGRCSLGYCAAAVYANSSLQSQAGAVALATAGTIAGYVEDGTFTRLRELALTIELPESIARAMRSRSVDITLAGRNLALWTRYTGVDPEVVSSVNIGSNFNNGAFSDIGGVPPAQYWIARISLGL